MKATGKSHIRSILVSGKVRYFITLNIVILFVVFFMLQTVPLFAAEKNEQMPMLAVRPFENHSGLPNFRWIGEYLSDMVAAQLSDIPGLKVIERNRLDKIFEEIELSLSGLSEEEIELGGLDVASHLMLGGYRIEGEMIHLTFRLIEVKSGKVILGESLSEDRKAMESVAVAVRQVVQSGLGMKESGAERRMWFLSLSQHRSLRRAVELWQELPFHELDPLRRRKKNEFQSRLNDLEAVLMAEPSHTEACYLSGQFYLQLGLYDDAAGYFDALLSDDIDGVKGKLGYGDLYRFQREMDTALEHYNEVLVVQGDNSGALYGKAKCLLRMNRYEEATGTLLHLLEVAPHLNVAHSLIAVCIDEIGCEAVIEASNTPVYAALSGIMSVDDARFCRAAEYFEKARADYPDLYLSEYSRGVCLLSQGRLNEAYLAVERVKQLHPIFPEVHRTSGEISMQQSDWKAAISSFRTYMNLSTWGGDFPEVREKIRYCEKRL